MKTTHQPTHKKAWLVLGIAAVLVIVSAFYLIVQGFNTKNYAEEVAKPIEQALIEAGGVKACGSGDTGRGVDNREPWVQNFYYLPIDQHQAEELVYKTANANGYSLSHASKEDRGPLSVADGFIDMWYYDYSSKQSPYDDLRSGGIKLAVIVDATGAGYNCGDSIPQDTTVVGIDIRLPDYK